MSTTNGHANTTFIGPGFGTVQTPTPAGSRCSPAVVSQRATLRNGLPGVYLENDLSMRFVGALETVLDPIAAVLDALPAHFSPDYAPRPILDLMAAWLGVELDEEQEIDARRESVRLAAQAARARGTVNGMKLALRLAFPGIPMRVEDEGGVRWSRDGKPAPAAPARFVVYVDTPVTEERASAIARCIEREKPIETTYRLRVRAQRAE